VLVGGKLIHDGWVGLRQGPERTAMNVLRALAAAMVLLAAPAQAFDLQGHRGARGLAPENTLAGFAKARRGLR
jgi:glycerophosphoryl diester phosphodiesterase